MSLSFDDGTADQYAAAPIIERHGMRASFFVNSGRIGTSPYYMTLDQIRGLYNRGHEIGGHTVNHRNLSALSADEQRAEICNDRTALLGFGFAVTDLAYPFGSSSVTRAVAQGCGYNAASTVGGIRSGEDCAMCPFAESIPPRDFFRTRTPNGVGPTTTLATLQRYVTQAEENNGGWVQLTFNRVCEEAARPANLPPCTVSPARLNEFLAWLAQRRSRGTTVRTVQQIVGGELQPSPEGGALPTPRPDSGLTTGSRDRTRPIVVRFRARPSRFRVARRGQPVSPRLRRGTTFRYILSERARVALRIQRALPGRRVGRSCRRPTRSNFRGRRCTRYVTVAVIRRSVRSLSNREPFTGRRGRRALPPGLYRATLRAVDAAGNRSRTRSARFRIVR